MSFLSSKRESGVIPIFDIGSGSVAGALVLLGEGKPPRVLYSIRSEIPFQERANGRRLLSLMLQSLSNVVEGITHEGYTVSGLDANRGDIREAFVSLSAPWITSRTSFLSLRNQEPIRVTSDVFDALLNEDAEGARRVKLLQGSVCIERKLIKSLLNGYETPSPFGKEASTAEFVVFGSFSLPRVIEKITDTIAHLLEAGDTSFHSFSLLTFAFLREHYPAEQDFMVTDVSGEQTEVSVVKRGALVETISFPFGKNTLIRVANRESGVPYSGISGLLRLYGRDEGKGRLYEQMLRALEKAKESWRLHFSRALASFSEEMFLPRSLFLTADDDVTRVFAEAVEGADPSAFSISSSSFRLIAIHNDVFDPLVSWNPSQPHDPFISLIALSASALRR